MTLVHTVGQEEISSNLCSEDVKLSLKPPLKKVWGILLGKPHQKLQPGSSRGQQRCTRTRLRPISAFILNGIDIGKLQFQNPVLLCLCPGQLSSYQHVGLDIITCFLIVAKSAHSFIPLSTSIYSSSHLPSLPPSLFLTL